MKTELYKIFKDKKRVIAIILMFLLPIFDWGMNVYETYSDYWFNREYYPGGLSASDILKPTIGSFLSGASRGHLFQMLLIWVIPIYVMIIYADGYIHEKELGYDAAYLTRGIKKRILRNKIQVSFIVPFVICVSSLMINHMLAHISFIKGTRMKGLDNLEGMTPLFNWSINNDELAYILFIISYSVIVGLYAIFCTNISMLINDKRIAYTIVTLLWIVMILSPYSVTYAIQPFTEYGLKYFLIAYLQIMILCVASLILTRMIWVNRDEI